MCGEACVSSGMDSGKALRLAWCAPRQASMCGTRCVLCVSGHGLRKGEEGNQEELGTEKGCQIKNT